VTYEVIHGERTHFLQAGNQYQTCLEALRIEAEENDIQQAPFDVGKLPNGERETIPMGDVLALRILANGDEIPAEPKMDLTRW
jgi:hypothetical protein